MALNLKDEQLHDEIKQLAIITGESQTEAVRKAVGERLHRLRANGRRERLRRISEASAALIPAELALTTDDLYDERGLPR